MGFYKDEFNPLLEKRIQKKFIPNEVTKTAQTTDATPLLVTNLLTIANNSLVRFTAYVTVVQSAGAAGTIGDSFCRKHVGAIKNIAGVTSFVDFDVWFEDIAIDAALSGIAIDFDANDANDRLDVQLTGELNKTLEYKIKIEFDSISY